MNKLIIYVSGPMTGIKEKNFPAFTKATAELRKKGYRVVNPAELEIEDPMISYEECIRRDIVGMMKCNAIATLPRWKYSKGAKLETHIAKFLKWPVHTVDYYIKRRIK